MKTIKTPRYPRLALAIGLTSVLLCAACTKTPDSSNQGTKTLTQLDGRKASDKLMRTLGQAVQLARACAISEAELQHATQVYSAVLSYRTAAQNVRALSEKEKRNIGTASEAEALFLEGTQSVVSQSPPTAEECAKRRASLPIANNHFDAGTTWFSTAAESLEKNPNAETAHRIVGAPD